MTVTLTVVLWLWELSSYNYFLLNQRNKLPVGLKEQKGGKMIGIAGQKEWLLRNEFRPELSLLDMKVLSWKRQKWSRLAGGSARAVRGALAQWQAGRRNAQGPGGSGLGPSPRVLWWSGFSLSEIRRIYSLGKWLNSQQLLFFPTLRSLCTQRKMTQM